MKIFILGGGPGGLYSGLLLKKANPSYEIQIVERNPANATYGWGVVFSDSTLNAFREADYQTYESITDNFVIWPAIDIHYKDRLIRCEGHRFAGLSRHLLLNILQERCRELGVAMTFETEITDFSIFDNYDLVIAADGVNSMVRQRYANAFRPTLLPGKAKFVWFGTDKVLDSFTFIFRENEHGLFQVHAYPFEGQTSTFIVECDEAVWKRAGLDEVDEAGSIAYCQDLFADFLQGHNLLSNRSLWTSFITVKNRSWRHKNIVLLGDSAHTAHFSIGSGTKLAMEDAIALAEGFARKEGLEAALNAYEMERRPRVAMLQEAALESQAYFENIRRYLHLEPLQFAFQLLTRSGRINYDNLRLRDPYFVDTVDRWFSTAGHAGDDAALMVAPAPLLKSLKLRDLALANRVVLASSPAYAARDGLPDSSHLHHLGKQARSGAALLLTEMVAVSANGRITPGCPGFYDESHLAAWKDIVAGVHETPARIALQLGHAGRRGATRPRHAGVDRPLPNGGWPLMAPSPIPYTAVNQVPKQMERTDMDHVRDAFVRATEMAHMAGFDMLYLNFAHGYLLATFLSPLTNRREDAYGGSYENRLRFPLELFDAVRAAWPAEKPLAVAINATDWANGGTEIEEAVATAAILKEHGCDLVEPLAGQTTPDARPTYGTDFLSAFSDQIRHEAHIATMTRGYITTSGEVNSILAAGRADLCIMNHT